MLHSVVDILVYLSRHRLLSVVYGLEAPSHGPVRTAQSLIPRSAYDFLKLAEQQSYSLQFNQMSSQILVRKILWSLLRLQLIEGDED